MRTEPLSNLEDRLKRYRADCFRVYAGELPAMFLLALFFSLGLFYGLNRYLGPIAYDWRLCAVAFALAVTFPPLLLWMPKKPTMKDVLRDQALRREYGLDDTVRK